MSLSNQELKRLRRQLTVRLGKENRLYDQTMTIVHSDTTRILWPILSQLDLLPV